jgi:histidinol-phosphate/aromatic aminotransferase/cobyric acid decarboxylase-like protein
LAVLRSLTKLFALPGLRIGYLLADAEVARAVQAALPPWNVSSPAQAAAVAALADGAVVEQVRAEVGRLRRAFAERLRRAGATVLAEGGPFLLCRVGDARRVAAELRARGCVVRDCSSLGLPDCVRVGVRPEGEQRVLADAWAGIA